MNLSRARTQTKYERMEYTHPEDIKMLQCVGIVRICEIPISQTQSAFNALLCLVTAHLQKHNP